MKSVASNIGKNVSIYPNVFLYNVNNLIIGDNVSIHPLCYIDAAGGI
ncbi:MAG: acyltransferase, partial [Flavobacteriaceae bacterium]